MTIKEILKAVQEHTISVAKAEELLAEKSKPAPIECDLCGPGREVRRYNCPKCMGNGLMPAPVEARVCDKCRGRGAIEHGNKIKDISICSSCSGTGKAPVEAKPCPNSKNCYGHYKECETDIQNENLSCPFVETKDTEVKTIDFITVLNILDNVYGKSPKAHEAATKLWPYLSKYWESKATAEGSLDGLEAWEDEAAAFHKATGYLRPGKDPGIIGDENYRERRDKAWKLWCAGWNYCEEHRPASPVEELVRELGEWSIGCHSQDDDGRAERCPGLSKFNQILAKYDNAKGGK